VFFFELNSILLSTKINFSPKEKKKKKYRISILFAFTKKEHYELRWWLRKLRLHEPIWHVRKSRIESITASVSLACDKDNNWYGGS